MEERKGRDSWELVYTHHTIIMKYSSIFQVRKGRHSLLRYDVKDICATKTFPLLTYGAGGGRPEILIISHSKARVNGNRHIDAIICEDGNYLIK